MAAVDYLPPPQALTLTSPGQGDITQRAAPLGGTLKRPCGPSTLESARPRTDRRKSREGRDFRGRCLALDRPGDDVGYLEDQPNRSD